MTTTAAVADAVGNPSPISDDVRAANVANQANAVTGIYGISGTGKSNLCDTGAEYAWETFKRITLCYAADLGGFGNKRLSLIRAGIMRVWDPRNHVNPFETMELMSLGAWPEEIIDPERGYADPNVRLILPRRIVYTLVCIQGHVAAKFEHEARLNASNVPCPTCGVVTSLSNCQRVDKAIVRHRMFRDVGLRIYDSLTALNEWGLQDLQEQSARGLLPAAGEKGGSLLGAADALVSGQFRFGSSSMGQYGFLQNRTYGWLSNIRKIPDQVVPAIATFHVEQSKGNDESGGDLLLGPKIAGNARTAALPGWLGNCLHSTKEPYSIDNPTLVYRLWLTNHIDPRDPRKIPYVAKHRGTPLGMPDYLEDKPGDPAWSGFSLKTFFGLLDQQLAQVEAETRAKYPDAPAFRAQGEDDGGEEDEIIGTVGDSPSANVPVPVTGGRTIGRRGRRPMAAAVAAPAPAPATSPAQSPTATDGAGSPAGAAPTASVAERAPAAPSVIAQQLQATLDVATASTTANPTASSGNGASSSAAAPAGGPIGENASGGGGSSATGTVPTPAPPSQQVQPAPSPPPPPAATATVTPMSRGIRRVPRPPV